MVRILALFLVLLAFSCGNSKFRRNEESNLGKNDYVLKPEKVSITSTKNGTFNLELQAYGKLLAKNSIEIKFKQNSRVERVYVKNAQRVIKGQLLAEQESQAQKNEYAIAKEDFESAKINFEDILVGSGYNLEDTASVPERIINNALNRSKYNTSLVRLKNARFNLDGTKVYAPINGIIADLSINSKSYPDQSSAFCKVIDDSSYKVNFQVVEDNYSFLREKQSIEIKVFSTQQIYHGFIHEINPIVDEQGLVSVVGVLTDSDKKIIQGMNVRVKIKKEINNKLYVPSESIVLRDGREVVFTCKNGRAIWNYVTTGETNYSFTVIENGLTASDTVIYKGQANLAHNSTVEIDIDD